MVWDPTEPPLALRDLKEGGEEMMIPQAAQAVDTGTAPSCQHHPEGSQGWRQEGQEGLSQ